ncbi:hypothetical protein IFM89_019085 [Coptis chinensis]|uniref:NPH3 domain-containing protein n=1 Tax=Coptis chinensis TaxID=261450 RepID=A0A835HNM0_9MAGN|nr:hypothetical protein IFM89_019085 [Coptis chinensis]
MAFLSSLLKTAIISSASATCRSDLERRMGLQLDQAILEDILIPTNSQSKNHQPLYETDTIVKTFSIFLNVDEDDNEENNLKDEVELSYDFDSPGSPKQSSILKVSKLLDNYLAEIALDSNLIPSKFIALAELLPDHARIISDGLYRAVDIFLKVHPNIKDSERYRLCKTIDCQKLSQEACSHAAQNESTDEVTLVGGISACTLLDVCVQVLGCCCVLGGAIACCVLLLVAVCYVLCAVCWVLLLVDVCCVLCAAVLRAVCCCANADDDVAVAAAADVVVVLMLPSVVACCVELLCSEVVKWFIV